MDGSEKKELFSGKEVLEKQYGFLSNKKFNYDDEFNKDNQRLYSKFRKYQDKKQKFQNKRDRMLKGVLQTASFTNSFIGGAMKNSREIEFNEENGIEVEDPYKIEKKKQMMGLSNLKKLNKLDIVKELNKREIDFKKENKKYTEQKKFKTLKKKTKNKKKVVKSVKNVSFFLRNKDKKSSYFQPERALSIQQPPATPAPTDTKKDDTKKDDKKKDAKKKKPKKKKSKKKKRKKVYHFNFKKMKWELKIEYKYGLIESVKEVAFWKMMGLKIKKHKVKLEPRKPKHKLYKKGQTQCVLTADFSSLMQFLGSNSYYFKAIFKSNCEEYNSEKLFKISNNWRHSRDIVIKVQNLKFRVQWGHRHGILHGIRYFDYVRTYPRFKNTQFMPFKQSDHLIKAGLITKKDMMKLNDKKHMKFFKKFRHKYPMPSVKHALKLMKALKRKKNKRKLTIAKEERELVQIKSQLDYSNNVFNPDFIDDRELYMDFGLIQQGYSKINNDSEQIIVHSGSNSPVIDRKTIVFIWSTSNRITYCSNRVHHVRCTI